MSRRTSFDLYQSVTDQVIEVIESSQAEGYELPWHRAGADVFRPRNAVTGEPYHGINVVSFWAAAEFSRFTSGTWATYKQWQQVGAQVRKGESSTVGVFFKQYQPKAEEAGEGEKSEETEGESESRPRWFARAFRVFNADQVEGYEAEELPEESLVERVGRADRFARATGAEIRHGGGRAFYSPRADAIQMPDEVRFRDTGSSTATEGYYSTLFHELTHWTGPESRCDRDLTGRFGDASYAMEELVAELGAAFLCAELAISPQPRPDHAGYIAHWMEVMKADKRAIFTAAARANEAAGFLRGL
jgi:antirestriction protein ArdC